MNGVPAENRDFHPRPDEQGAPELTDIELGDVTWKVDLDFFASSWTCIWGRGCVGILDEPAEELAQGCCSVGARLSGGDEQRLLSARAAMLDSELFEHHEVAAAEGIVSDDRDDNTRVVDGACIFLNRPGFAGGVGCALHLQALADGDSPIDWKPSVCWQLPVHLDWTPDPERSDAELATLRRWSRADWGSDGATMAWCCTEGERAYVGEERLIDSLAEELEEMVGRPVMVEIRRRLDHRDE